MSDERKTRAAESIELAAGAWQPVKTSTCCGCENVRECAGVSEGTPGARRTNEEDLKARVSTAAVRAVVVWLAESEAEADDETRNPPRLSRRRYRVRTGVF